MWVAYKGKRIGVHLYCNTGWMRVQLWWGSSSLGVSQVFRQVASDIVADKAFAVSHMFSPFGKREIDLAYFHSVGVPVRMCHPWLCLLDVCSCLLLL